MFSENFMFCTFWPIVLVCIFYYEIVLILNAAVGKSIAQWILVRNRQTKPNPSTYILDLKAWEKPMSKGHFSAAASHFLICLFLLYSKVNLEIQGRGIYVLVKSSKGPSINDVSTEGEGGGLPSKPIYYISLFSNLSRQGEGGGS